MRTLTAGTNIDPASPDYPNGRVRDLNGGAGTLVNEALFGDMVQFFQKLIIDAGITPNGLPDNVTNGYELLTALLYKIYDYGVLGEDASSAYSASDYNIPDGVGNILFTYSGTQIQNVVTPTPKKGRTIMIRASNNLNVNNKFVFTSATNWYDDQSGFDPTVAMNLLAMISDGVKWLPLNYLIIT